MTPNGMFYHYSQVCSLLRIYGEEIKQQLLNNTIEDKESNTRPEWLSDKIKSTVKTLWDKENINHSNPRVAAVKLVISTAEQSGYTIGIKKATEIINQHCLTN